jgi:purine nucleosidase
MKQATLFYMRHHFLGYGERACFIHDPVAVAAVIWPELFHCRNTRVDVETEGRLTRGLTVADLRPEAYRQNARPNAEVCFGMDADYVVAWLLERLGAHQR